MRLVLDLLASRCLFCVNRVLRFSAVFCLSASLSAESAPELSRCAGVVGENATSSGLVFADGSGLPGGMGRVSAGEDLYLQRCRGCHGDEAMGAVAVELVGSHDSLSQAFPDKAVGSFWYAAPTLFGYIQQAMPPQNADRTINRLSNDETYAVVAYLLWLNGLVDADIDLDAELLGAIKMPNRDGFDRSKQADDAKTHLIKSVCAD